MNFRTSISAILLLLVLSGCSNTRFLTDDQMLYTGRGKIEVIPEGEGVDTKRVEADIKGVTDHKVNNGIFGRRMLPPVGLWTYNYWHPKKEGKFIKWLYSTLSAPPILLSDINPELRAQVIENELFNNGYFKANAWTTIDSTGKNLKKARLSYHVSLAPPYFYDQIEFDTLRDPVDSLIRDRINQEPIKPGEQFNLATLTTTRRNIARELQNNGYFFFTPEFIQLRADTSLRKGSMNLMVGRSESLPPSVLSAYDIHQVTILITKPSSPDTTVRDTVQIEDLTIVSPGHFLEAGLLWDAIFLRKGELYTYDRYQQTINRLNNLGVFSFVRISFQPVESDTLQHVLDVQIDGILADNISLDLETDLVTKSTGYAGPALSVMVSHGNAFKGAEKVYLGLNGGFEWQWGKKSESQLGTFSYELGLTSGLAFPRILIPNGWKQHKPLFLQLTSINLDFKLLNRTAYYRMASTMTNLNYRWSGQKNIQHSFSPLYLNNVQLLNTTPAFDSVVDENIYIRKSFEEQFILGTRYSFTFDNTNQAQPNNFYLTASVNTSGNLVDLLAGIGRDEGDRPYALLNSIYSQFLKFTTDFRYYRNWKNHTLVTRLYAGVGIPYSNSTVLPYVEQFFSGGAYSIRGFTARYVGPGSYYEEKSGYIDQSGDVKLEGNLEYRFGISKILKGAVYLEAGNIWLINEDENRPGAKFDFHTFYDELAVGTGAGLRFDFDFFVLRTDLGFPLRNAYRTDGKNWLFGSGNILSGVLFYLAIGYPF
jgi:outer membrane protein assembly factor BamA